MIEEKKEIGINKKETKNGNIKQSNIDKIKQYVSIILVIIWMVIVFMFSSEVGTDSSSTSGETIKHILTTFKSDWNPSQLEDTIELLQPYARKIAHFTLYTIGGFLIYNLNRTIKQIKAIENKNKYVNVLTISLLFGIFYAITDEVHQIFVIGRDGRVLDVFIDSLGVLFGIVICKLIEKILKK